MNESRYVQLLRDADKFWSLVDKEPDAKGCWIFFGTVHESGYGHFRSAGTKILAHRAAWILTNGMITSEQWVCHSCDNRPCCNPGHHFLGDSISNHADMMAKGRQSKGPNKSRVMIEMYKRMRADNPEGYKKKMCRIGAMHSAKVTAEQIRLIRESELPSLQIAPHFGVDPSTIRKIRRGVTWRGVEAKNAFIRPTGRQRSRISK